MGQCLSSIWHQAEGLQNKRIGFGPTWTPKAERRRSTTPTRKSGDGERSSTTSTPKSLDGKLSTAPAQKSVGGKLSPSSIRRSGGGKLSTSSTRNSVDGKLPTSSTRNSVDGKLPISSTRNSVNGKLPTSSTRNSVDGKLSTSTRNSMDGKLPTTSTRNSVDGKSLSTTASGKSVDGRSSATSARRSLDEGPLIAPTCLKTCLKAKFGAMFSTISNYRKSIHLKPSPTSARKSVEVSPATSVSTRKSADRRPSPSTRKSVEVSPATSVSTRKSADRRPSPSTRKSVEEKPGSTKSTRKSVDRSPSPTSARKSVEGKRGSETKSTRKSGDGKRSNTVARKSLRSNKSSKKHRDAGSLSGYLRARSTDDAKLLGVLHRHEIVASTEAVQELGWFLHQEAIRDSWDYGNSRARARDASRSRDTSVTPPAMSSSKGDDHARSSIGYRSSQRGSVEREPLERKSFNDHGKPGTRSRDSKSIDRESIDSKDSIDTNSMERKSVEWQLVEFKFSEEGKTPQRQLLVRNDVEPTIDDEMDVTGISSLDIIRGNFSTSADQNSNRFKAITSRNPYLTRRGSSPARLTVTYVPESGELCCPPEHLDFLAQRFLIDKHETTAQARTNWRSVQAGQNDQTDAQTPRDSLSAQERDEIRKSYRKSASKAASLDLDAFKSMAMTMVAT